MRNLGVRKKIHYTVSARIEDELYNGVVDYLEERGEAGDKTTMSMFIDNALSFFLYCLENEDSDEDVKDVLDNYFDNANDDKNDDK